MIIDEKTVRVKVKFSFNDRVGLYTENYRKELKKIKIPKGGLFTKKSKHKEICELKRIKRVYEKLLDLEDAIENLNGRILRKEFFYDQGEKRNQNWALYTIQFKSEKRKEKFEKIYFELYPDCKVSDEADV